MPVLAFNSEAPAYAGVILPEHIHFHKEDWKYADIEYLFPRLPSTLQHVVEQAPLKGGYKRTLLDIKVQLLVPEKTSCIPGWHLDGPENPLHDSQPEVHHLFVRGGGPTEFIDQELTLQVQPDMNQRELVAQIPDEVSIKPIGLNAFHSFTRFDFHRGVNVAKPLTRLLIRVTETDTILARNKPFTQAVGGRNGVKF